MGICVDIRYEGDRAVMDLSPCVIVANHLALIDSLLLEAALRSFPRVWIVKFGLTKIPILSFIVRRMHVPVVSNNQVKMAAAFRKSIRLAKRNNSHLVLFPEGRRSLDGNLEKFTAGFAKAAIILKRPVVPINIEGSDEVMKLGSPLFTSGKRIKLAVGSPMEALPGEDHNEFCERVHKWFSSK
ncbi:1-acyl-sn-glycerol-3-phosphate acyltransferase [bacterium]|nr:1-acyl-sn-glycerol-3-phosphate acyltransferase [bacterium]